MLQRLTSVMLALALAMFCMPAFAQGQGKNKDDAKQGKPAKKDKKKKKEKKGKDGKKDRGDKKGKPDKAKGDKTKGKAGDLKGQGKADSEPTSQPTEPADKAKQIDDEKQKHLKRLAKIQRLADLGAKKKGSKLVEKAKMLNDKENRRHERAMKRLEEAPDDKKEKKEKKEDKEEK